MATSFPVTKTPLIIPGLMGWYDASTTPTGSVASWSDKSGNNFHAVQVTGSKQPTCTANQQAGKNTLVFDGARTLQVPAGLLVVTLGASTMYAVANSSIDNTVQRISRFTGASGNYGLSYNSVAGEILFAHGNSTPRSFNGTTKSNYNLIVGRNSGTTQAISVNGAAEVTNALGSDFTADISGWIGATLGTSQFLTGNIAELIIYQGSHSAAQMLTVNRYLSNKWGTL